MMSSDEQLRLDSLRSYRVLDTPKEQSFDRVVELAAALFEVPMAAISLIDTDRQWFKAEVGLGIRQTPRHVAFCHHTIQCPNGLLVVEDALSDAQFQNNPLVTGNPHIRFYAGVALTNPEGLNLGSLCVIGTRPQVPSKLMLDQLALLAKIAVSELELAKARAAISEKQQLLELAERMSGVGHWRYDIQTGKIDWSDEVYRIHGVTRETFDTALDDAIAFYHPEDRDHIRQCLTDAIATGNGYEFARRLEARDGVTRNVTGKAVCEVNAEGKVTAMFGVFQDVTEHRRALDAAREAVAVKADFLANMSHELRTPLTSVIGFADLLSQQPELSERSQTYISRVTNGSRALLATVNDVLDFSKLEAGQVELRPQPTSTRQLFQEAVDLFLPQVDAKGVSLALHMADTLPDAVLLDADRIRQLLLNLVGNAVKFTARGHIRVDVDYAAPDTLSFSVADTGPGMSETQLAKLFQRFSQVDGSLSRSHGGTGLGLAICKGLVDAIGGRVGVTSEAGKGSRFEVSFAAPIAALTPNRDSRLAAVPALADYRVLVVDDNASNRALVAASLKATGIELTMAADGKEAVGHAALTPFDMILLDLHMPGMDGHAVLKIIRGAPGPNHGIPIMAFTADADGSEMRHLIDAGFDGIVSKPILPNELIRQLSSVLAGQESPEPQQSVRHG